jgi:hypothetical protein
MAKTLIGQYRSNSSSTTNMKVEWESISATLIRVYFTYILGSSTALGTGNSRDARVWIYDNDGTQIGYASVEVKGRYDTWTYSTTYYGTVDVTIPYRSNVTLKVTAKTVVGTWTTGVNSCLWDATANTNYPSLASISWPTYNTAPYWPAGSSVTVTPNGTIPENTTSLAVSWPAASDDQSDTLYYDVYRVVGGVSTKIQDGGTGRSLTDDVSALGQGTAIRYDVYVRDASLYASAPIQSSTVTKNTLTPATLAGSGAVAFDSTTIALTRNNASNTNGNGTFTYTLGLTGLTLYNTDVSAVGQTINVSIWRAGGYPTGPYIKFDDLKTYLASSYVGSLVFTLTTTNAYGSSGSTSKTIAADIRTNPTGLGSVVYSGGYTIASVLRYIPDQRAITVGWSAATDPLGTAIVYDVYYKLAADTTWTQARTGLSTLSTTIAPPSGDAQLSYNVKVVARSAYGYTQEASGAALAIDKYLRPIIKLISRKRTSTGVDISLEVEFRSSFAAALALTTFTYTKLGGAAVSLGTSDLTPDFTYTEPGVFLISSSYTMVVTVQDNAGVVIGSAEVTANVAISAYTPMLSVRRKGVGVNCIPDGTYALDVGGKLNATTIYRNGTELADVYQAKGNELAALQALADTAGFIKKTGDGAYAIDTAAYLTTAGKAADSDKLDARDSTAFAFSENQSSADLNTIVQSGMYRLGPSNTNLPSGCAYGQLLVVHGAEDTILQIASDYTSTLIYWRSGNPSQVGGAGSWGAWRSLWHSGNLTPSDYHPTSKIAVGSGTSSSTGGGDTSVSFGKTFANAPKVCANSTGANSYTCRIKSVSTTGFILVISGASIGFNYIAVEG